MITDVFRRDGLVHLCVMAAIVAATFQGYLKDRIAGPLPYALSDAAFIFAALVWFGSLTIRHQPIRGPGSVPTILVIVIFLPALYLLHPGTPLAVELAGLRTWTLFPVAGVLGLSVIHDATQLRAYVALILGLCVVTAVYGIAQYVQGPETLVRAGELALERHGATVFYRAGDETEFRAFSTFTFPAPFAAMMVYGMLLAAGIATSRVWRRPARVGAALLIPLFFMGMTVSGTRAALVVLLIGLAILAWYRRLSVVQVLLVPVVLAALHVATLLTAGRIVERYRTLLLEEGVLWSYVSAPILTAARYLAEYPFGIGLGRTGIGVPFVITRSYPRDYFVFTDGDIGRAAVELGIFGTIVLALIVFMIVRYLPWAMQKLRGTTSEDLALGAGALVLSAAVVLLIGSPFSSSPHGIIWWFFFGGLLKLAMVENDEGRTEEREDGGRGGR